MAAPTTITVCSPKHHKQLVDGLWKRLQKEVEVDVDVTWGGWSTRAHRLVLDVFLSPDKLVKSEIASPEIEPEENSSLHSLVEFLYRGRVTVAKKQLPQLLKAAKWTNFRLLVDALEKVSRSSGVTNDSSGDQSGSQDQHVNDYLQGHIENRQDSQSECKGSPAFKSFPVVEKSKSFHAGASKRQLDKNINERSSELSQSGSNSTEDREQKGDDDRPNHGDNVKSVDEVAETPKRRRSRVTDKRHRCKQCDFATNRPYVLLAHIRTIHLLEKPFECEICQRKFARIDNLRSHRRQHTNERPYKCGECEMAFFSSQRLADHKYVHLDSNTFKCDECDKLYRNAGSLRIHKRQCHLHAGFLKCKLCQEVFDSKASLEEHALRHKEGDGFEKKHVCEICGHASKRAYNLSIHMKTHQNERPFECPECHKTFKQKSNLTIHQMTHTATKMCVCDICGRAFLQPTQLKMHRLTHDPNRPKRKPKTFQCSKCEKSFTTNQHLKYHELTHTGNLPHICQVCGKGFPGKSALDAHVRTHDKARPFECRLCRRTFRLERNLQGHMKRLHGEGNAYSTKVRPYTCPVCHWGFTQKCSLTKHSRLHSGTLPHKCDYCDKQFNQRNHLTLHKSAHHPDKT